MIDKPKRPRQPDIQERQPPRTLQELINRYDLDNTKIYDFLDELVGYINEGQILTKNLEINSLTIASKQSVYNDITVPTIQGYTCIGINLERALGSGNGYCNITVTSYGQVRVYNGGNSEANINIQLKAIYLKD